MLTDVESLRSCLEDARRATLLLAKRRLSTFSIAFSIGHWVSGHAAWLGLSKWGAEMFLSSILWTEFDLSFFRVIALRTHFEISSMICWPRERPSQSVASCHNAVTEVTGSEDGSTKDRLHGWDSCQFDVFPRLPCQRRFFGRRMGFAEPYLPRSRKARRQGIAAKYGSVCDQFRRSQRDLPPMTEDESWSQFVSGEVNLNMI